MQIPLQPHSFLILSQFLYTSKWSLDADRRVPCIPSCIILICSSAMFRNSCQLSHKPQLHLPHPFRSNEAMHTNTYTPTRCYSDIPVLQVLCTQLNTVWILLHHLSTEYTDTSLMRSCTSLEHIAKQMMKINRWCWNNGKFFCSFQKEGHSSFFFIRSECIWNFLHLLKGKLDLCPPRALSMYIHTLLILPRHTWPYMLWDAFVVTRSRALDHLRKCCHHFNQPYNLPNKTALTRRDTDSSSSL